MSGPVSRLGLLGRGEGGEELVAVVVCRPDGQRSLDERGCPRPWTGRPATSAGTTWASVGFEEPVPTGHLDGSSEAAAAGDRPITRVAS